MTKDLTSGSPFKVIMLFMLVLISILEPKFAQPTNFLNIFTQISINGLIAYGMCLAITTGGRNITVVGKGANLQEANKNAYDLIRKKAFRDLWYREDIGNAYFE